MQDVQEVQVTNVQALIASITPAQIDQTEHNVQTFEFGHQPSSMIMIAFD